MRHAHAVDHWPGGDHARPLAAKGRREVAAFGYAGGVPGPLTRALAVGCRRPDLVVSSSAERARGTAEGAAAALGAGAMQVDRSLYRADADDLVAWLAVLPDDVGAVMVVGHNPAVHDLLAVVAVPPPAAVVDGSTAPAASSPARTSGRGTTVPVPEGPWLGVPTRFTPGSVAVLALDPGRWASVAPGSGRIIFVAVN